MLLSVIFFRFRTYLQSMKVGSILSNQRGMTRFLTILGMLLSLTACSKKEKFDSCCTFADLPSNNSPVGDGKGLLRVEGSTSAQYYVLDEAGNQVARHLINESLPLDPGQYQIRVNNSHHVISVDEGVQTICATGTVLVAGNTSDYYHVLDSAEQQLAYEGLGKPISLFPGSYHLRVNNTLMSVEVKLKELIEVRTGTLTVGGNTGESYYVLDDANKQLNYNTLGKPLAFFPGTYLLKVNNTSKVTEVLAGQDTKVSTGELLVRGLTEEYYYVTDTVGNALNYQSLNRSLSFFPGPVHIKLNNTVRNAHISPGKTTEFVTGSLMLTGGGTGYYYVLDDMGAQLNYNSLNKSLSFFPAEYTVRLGSSSRKATVAPGQLTSLSAFN